MRGPDLIGRSSYAVAFAKESHGMQLSDSQLSAFRSRCLRASMKGYDIARASVYLKALAEETGSADAPEGVKEGSAAHLLAMAEAAMEARASGGKKPKGKAAPKPPAPKKAEPEPEPETDPAPDAEEEVPPYEEWSYDELYAEAKERDIDGRSKMGKDELVAALEADDEADGG